MKSFIILLMLVGCAKQPVPAPSKPVVAPVNHTAVAYKFRWNNAAWDKELVRAIKASGLDKVMPKDAKEFGYKSGTDMVKFYGNILVEMVYFESRFNTNSKYHEPMGMWSRGLFQVSLVDARRYKGCDFKTESDVHKPLMNIKCGVYISYKLINQNKRIAGKVNGKWQGDARYWAVLRGTRSYTKKSLTVIKNCNKL